jgi:hypothetical protein
MIIILAIISIVFYILFKLNVIKNPLDIASKINNMKHNIKNKKSFAEATLRQFSCKHQNLEQQKDILICSDCGKII